VPVKGCVAKCTFCDWRECHATPGQAQNAYADHMTDRHKTLNAFDRSMLKRMQIPTWEGSTDEQ
jgi:hypothetical protein